MDLPISARLPFSDSRTTAGLADAAAKIISRGKVSLMLKQYGDMIRAADVKKAEQWESQSDLSKFEQAPINMHKLQALIDYLKTHPSISSTTRSIVSNNNIWGVLMRKRPAIRLLQNGNRIEEYIGQKQRLIHSQQ